MSSDDSQLKVIHDLICRVDDQRKQLQEVASKLRQLNEQIGREIVSGPLSRDPEHPRAVLPPPAQPPARNEDE